MIIIDRHEIVLNRNTDFNRHSNKGSIICEDIYRSVPLNSNLILNIQSKVRLEHEFTITYVRYAL